MSTNIDKYDQNENLKKPNVKMGLKWIVNQY